MTGTPKRPVPGSPGIDVPIRVNVKLNGPLAEVELSRRCPVEVNRSVYLKREDFETYGYTIGCAGCRRLKTGILGYKNHTAEWRRRMEESMNEDRQPRIEHALNVCLLAEASAHSHVQAGSSAQLKTERKRGREDTDQAQAKLPKSGVADRGHGDKTSGDSPPEAVAESGNGSIGDRIKRQASKELSSTTEAKRKCFKDEEEDGGGKRLASKQGWGG